MFAANLTRKRWRTILSYDRPSAAKDSYDGNALPNIDSGVYLLLATTGDLPQYHLRILALAIFTFRDVHSADARGRFRCKRII